MKITQRIAVKTLVESVLRRGNLLLTFGVSGRAVEAIYTHRKIQKSRPPGYVPEVSIAHEVEGERVVLSIGGRIDGIYNTEAGVIIDEIKTTTRDLSVIKKTEDSLHWGQAKAYAYMYAAAHNLKKITVQLTYYHLDTHEIFEKRHCFTWEDLGIFFSDLVSRYLEWAESVASGHVTRDESIRNLDFPFEDYRSGQREMAVAVYRAIRDRKQLIVQAATGIGKTMSSLFPAVKALAEGLISKVFFLTARTTGKHAVEQAITELKHAGLRIKTLTITAKDKICFCPDVACVAEECEFAKGYYDRVNQAKEIAIREDTFTRDVIEWIAKEHSICPFEFSLELALWVDCIVCDYNYAFDPRVYLRRFFKEENNDYVFLIDESHNLVDRSRDMFSAAISKQPFLDLRRAVKNDLPRVYKCMGKINSWLIKVRKQCRESGAVLVEKQGPTDLYPLLKLFLKTMEGWLADNVKKPFRKDLLALYFTVNNFMKVSERYDETYATCYMEVAKDVRVNLFCIDPSTQLKSALNRGLSAIFFSATLTPMPYYIKVFGCDTSVNTLMLPSPFPRENLCVLISDHISTLYTKRDQTKGFVYRAILDFVKQKQGNYLIFFPSYEYMMKVHELVAQENHNISLMVQTPGMAESDRDHFLDQFTRKNSQTFAGFVVMGGIFAEGIDLVGDRLTGAVIVGVGLPGISPERDLIRQYFDRIDRTGFDHAYLYPGITRVFQAAGRVIRSEQDRGVVLLIDERFSGYRYTSLFPREWHPIRVQGVNNLASTLERFWDTNSG